MEQTSLLKLLIRSAEVMVERDEKKVVSVNYFFMAVLAAIMQRKAGELPEGFRQPEMLDELSRVEEMLAKYDIDEKKAVRDIKNAMQSEGYFSSMDQFTYEKFQYNQETVAKKRGLSVIDATVYVEMILTEPTHELSELVLIEKTDLPVQKKHPDPAAQTAWEDTADDQDSEDDSAWEDLFNAEEDYETEDQGEGASEETEPDEKKKVGGVEKLARLVQATRDIQTHLLENIFGQDQAVNTFTSGYFQAQLMASSRKGNKKPQAVFLLAGPPGTGKTYLAEKAAEALKLPYQRFDMSEYADKEANIEFCGSDKVYKNGKAGNVTEFVSQNPQCVLLFDEIEKAHLNVIYLFLQILDAGRLRDNYTDEEVSFTDAIIIFTTNAGKNLYEDPTVANLSALPRKKILKALATDMNPMTGTPLFPAAICSRFASGNVVMFNHLEASNLFTIAQRELQSNIKGFEKATGISINMDDRVPSALMLSEGGKADARTVKGRANAFFHEELYELLRLLSSGKGVSAVRQLKDIHVTVPVDGMPAEISAMFENSNTPQVLIFAGQDMADACRDRLEGQVVCHVADDLSVAKDVLFNYDIDMVLCDVNCNVREDGRRVLDAEDISSVGHDFMMYVLEKYALPVYLLQDREGDITQEEFLSFARLGVRDLLSVQSEQDDFAQQVTAKCRVAYQQSNMLRLARENKALMYKTAQTVSEDGQSAVIHLYDFHLSLVTDTEDAKNVLDNVSRPNVHFSDVIGAEDAKQELTYFVSYLQNPIKYMRRGVRSPKGVLLYGPPGTGKTLLAKAMAGESGVTFLRAEGNEFLRRYVGEGAEAIHSLFNAARKYAPSIVFIDEIDAIGKDRNGFESGDNTGDVLTALLTELDGFHTDTTKPVFLLAATNYEVTAGRGRSLDPALVRRFDRQIFIDLPNKDERKRYLEMKLSKTASAELSPEQIDNIALRSTGMSLSELESVYEMALRNAIRSENGRVGDAEFEEAFETFNGGERREWSKDTLLRTARHEAGHALICWLGGEKPTYLTVVARGDHGGYMQHANSEGKSLYTKAELIHKIRTSLGGRAAEMVYYGAEDGLSTGASGDLFNATQVAEQMICHYGMDATVGMSYRDAGKAEASVRERVNRLLDDALAEAVRTVEQNRSAIDALVNALMEKNHLKENEIDDILKATTT